jgi:hypothetical protein
VLFRSGLGSAESRSHPAAMAMGSMLGGHGRHVLHVGAVEHDGLAALIVGAPGAGKSTTALAAAIRGAGFIGDDLCVVDGEEHWIDGAPDVHALYASAKFWHDSGERLGLGGWSTMGRTDRDKPVVSVTDHVRVVRRARVCALVMLQPPGPHVHGPSPIGATDALRGLIPTARSSVLGDSELRRWLPLATAMARRIPAYQVGLGWDLDGVADALRCAIDDGAHRGPR